MLRCMLGSVKGVKSENPKGKGEFRKWEGGDLNQFPKFPFPPRVLTFNTFHTSQHASEHAQ